MAIDLKRFNRLFPKGKCSVDSIDGDVRVEFKRYDNETGEELAPEWQFASEEELQKLRVDLLSQVDAIDTIFGQLQ